MLLVRFITFFLLSINWKSLNRLTLRGFTLTHCCQAPCVYRSLGYSQGAMQDVTSNGRRVLLCIKEAACLCAKLIVKKPIAKYAVGRDRWHIDPQSVLPCVCARVCASYLDCKCSNCTCRFSVCSTCSSRDLCSFLVWLWDSSNWIHTNTRICIGHLNDFHDWGWLLLGRVKGNTHTHLVYLIVSVFSEEVESRYIWDYEGYMFVMAEDEYKVC